MKVMIIGGVAAGASTAARLRRLDESAEIVVLERSDYVSFANCGLPYYIGEVIKDRAQLLLQTPQTLKASLNLDVRTGHEALEIDREAHRVRVKNLASGETYDETYDKLVLCPGATPLRPNLPGIDLPEVYVLRNVEDTDRMKKRVDAGARSAVVIGAGYIGVEMAENLRDRGMAVDVVEMVDQIMPPLDPEMAWDLQLHMQQHGVTLHLGVSAAAFRQEPDGRIAVELKNGEVLQADMVVLSAGVRPDTALALAAGLELGPRGGIRTDQHMRTSDPDIFAAGDAVEVANAVLPDRWLIPLAGPANSQGRVVAENIAGRATTYASAKGTAIVKIFDMTAGGTGASEKALRRAAIPYHKIYLHPSNHAGYYPGGSSLHVKVLFAPEDGRLLGAQVVGYDGVDKRIDVFATALAAKMTVFDLQQLELAYAPPFGSARDPVNMAGFIGSNVILGDAQFWYPEDYPEKTEGGVIVDVRGKAEYDMRHIPGAISIPMGELRGRLGELPKDRKIFLYCAVGFRSYLAYRALRQLGYTCCNLAGGLSTFRSWHKDQVAAGEQPPPFMAYAEEKQAAAAAPSGKVVELDCSALQCPGPIVKLKAAMEELDVGDEIVVIAGDPGFRADAPAWCAGNGHTLVEIDQDGPRVRARIRKGPGGGAGTAATVRPTHKTFVVFSGDLDRVMAAFIIANGALAMGHTVTLFFTFWGLNALRREPAPETPKGALDRMFGMMMPAGAGALKLSKMNMMGLGTAMMKYVMHKKNVQSLPDLMDQAIKGGVKLVACSMSMDVMGLRREELIDGVELGGVASFLGEADRSGTTLFI